MYTDYFFYIRRFSSAASTEDRVTENDDFIPLFLYIQENLWMLVYRRFPLPSGTALASVCIYNYFETDNQKRKDLNICTKCIITLNFLRNLFSIILDIILEIL